MKNTLRLAMVPLALAAPETIVAYALHDRHRKLLRSGQSSLRQLAQTIPDAMVQVILHPDDAVVTSITLPPLPAKRLDAAVQSSVEPLALSDISSLCIAHGPRAADGSVGVAWTDRAPLLQAWGLLDELGFRIEGFVPLALALAQDDPQPDRMLTLPANERWLAPLPAWSLARPEWRPVSQSKRWRGPLIWLAAAVVLWLAGLQIYAAQLRNEAEALRASTETAVRTAFPSISIILDPVKQARSQRDMLRQERGSEAADGFMPLAMGAAQVLTFANGHIASMRYDTESLTLVLNEGYVPPSNEVSLHQAAAALSLDLEKDAKAPHTWHIRYADTPLAAKGQP